MTKRIISLVISVLMIMSCLVAMPVSAANIATVTVTATPSAAGPGDTVTITISITEFAGAQFDVDLSSVPETLEFVSADWTLTPTPAVSEVDTDKKLAAAIYFDEVTVSGDIFKAVYKVADDATATKIDLSIPVKLWDVDYNVVVNTNATTSVALTEDSDLTVTLRPEDVTTVDGNPYYLSGEDIKWVEDTIAGMTDEEKVGQLFFQLTQSQDENYIKDLLTKYHLGGCRYNANMPTVLQEQNRNIQKFSKIPAFIACNTEQGGDGAFPGGTFIGSGAKIGATRNKKYAYELGRIANTEAAAIGCNMAFSPVCDIAYNWENTECICRAFGNDAEVVAEMSAEYVKGAHKVPGFACAAKHFPGNGLDFRDAHLSNNCNEYGEAEWMATFG